MNWLKIFSYPKRLHEAGVLGMNSRNYKVIAHLNQRRLYPLVDDKVQTKKSLSVGSRNVKSNEKNKFEIINKTKEDRDQRLYIKLILARNKFNKSNMNQQDIYLDILNKIAQLKEFPDKSGEIKKELDEIENNLKMKNIVLCPDVQIVDDNDETDSIGKQMSLDFIINKMKIKSDY